MEPATMHAAIEAHLVACATEIIAIAVLLILVGLFAFVAVLLRLV